MGMGPRRLLVLHSNLMRTDKGSIQICDSTARDVQERMYPDNPVDRLE